VQRCRRELERNQSRLQGCRHDWSATVRCGLSQRVIGKRGTLALQSATAPAHLIRNQGTSVFRFRNITGSIVRKLRGITAQDGQRSRKLHDE